MNTKKNMSLFAQIKSIFIILRSLQLKVLKYKENNKKICDIFEVLQIFSFIYVMTKVHVYGIKDKFLYYTMVALF